MKEPPVSILLGLPFHHLDMEQALASIESDIVAGQGGIYVTANVDFVAQAYRDAELRRIIFFARRIICDGMPLVWLSKLLGKPLPGRVAGSDMTLRLFELAERKGWRPYLFGSDSATLERTAGALTTLHPNLRLAGWESPPVGPIASWDNEAIAARIRAARPEILLTALGCPKQERWMAAYWDQLGVPVGVGIGASLDFIAGKQIRAPLWMQRSGLEWLWRVGREPRRLFGRYARDFYYLALLSWRQARLQKAERRRHRLLPTETRYDEEQLTVLRWSGRVDASNVATQTQPPHYRLPVAVMLQSVTMMDSAGMGLLASIARQAFAAGVPCLVCQPSPLILNLLRTLRLDTVLQICLTEQALRESLAHPVKCLEQTNEVLVLAPRFRLFADSVEAFLEQAEKALHGKPQARDLILDLSGSEALDSAGAGALLELLKRCAARRVRLILRNPSAGVRRTLHFLHLDDCFTIQ